MVSPQPTTTEADILADVIAPEQGDFPPEFARSVLGWKFSDKAADHMGRLAEQNQQGQITPQGRDELERYVRVGSFINLLQAKARLSLQQSAGGSH
jgi:hypothetical protein